LNHSAKDGYRFSTGPGLYKTAQSNLAGWPISDKTSPHGAANKSGDQHADSDAINPT
jgi:hypothetical protein